MISDLRLSTKIAVGLLCVMTLLLALFYNGRVFSTTLPRYTFMLAATAIVFVLAALSLVDEFVSG